MGPRQHEECGRVCLLMTTCSVASILSWFKHGKRRIQNHGAWLATPYIETIMTLYKLYHHILLRMRTLLIVGILVGSIPLPMVRVGWRLSVLALRY